MIVIKEKLFAGKIQPLSKDFPAVQVERINHMNLLRIMDDGLCMVDKDTLITELPHNYKIVDMEDREVKPTGKFFICVDSIDPYYFVVDLPIDFIK